MDGWSGVEAWNCEETQGQPKQHTCGFAGQRRVLGDAPRRKPQPASSAGSMVRPDREGGGGCFGGLGCWSVCPPFASDQLSQVGVPSVKRTSSPILAKEHQPRGGVCVGGVWLVARVGAAPRFHLRPRLPAQAWRCHLLRAPVTVYSINTPTGIRYSSLGDTLGRFFSGQGLHVTAGTSQLL